MTRIDDLQAAWDWLTSGGPLLTTAGPYAEAHIDTILAAIPDLLAVVRAAQAVDKWAVGDTHPQRIDAVVLRQTLAALNREPA